MSRCLVVAPVLVLGLVSLLTLSRSPVGVGAQDTTETAGHALVGAWIVEEVLLPQNAPPGTPPSVPPPQAVAVASFFTDDNVLVSGFGGNQPSLQGTWSMDGERTARFSVVGLLIGGSGVSDGTLGRVRATVELDAAGTAFTGDYSFEVIEPDGRVSFTHYGSWSGTRVEVDPVDLATPSAQVPVVRT